MHRVYVIIILLIFPVIIGNAQLNKHLSRINPEYIEYMKKHKQGISGVSDSLYGYIPPVIQLPEYYSSIKIDESNLKSAAIGFDSIFDLRKTGNVSVVKDQGAGRFGGNCWTFAAMGAIESEWMVKGFGEKNLSEQNLATCHGYLSKYGQGGNDIMSMGYFTKLQGPLDESSDPYNTNEYNCISGLPVLAFVPEVRWVYNKRNYIKQVLKDYGAVTTVMCWDDNSYSKDLNNTYYYNGNASPNHEVVIAGWDDTKVTKAPVKGAWIVKNQWTTAFGDNGYFYISYMDSKVLNPVSYYPVRWEIGSIDTMYNYAHVGLVSFYGDNINEQAAAIVKFTTPHQQYLTKVGTFLSMTGSTVNIDVFDKSGHLLSDFTSKPCQSPGFYTFDMPTIVNGTFTIRVIYNTPGNRLPIPLELFSPDFANPFIQPSGKQWVLLNGGTYQPLGSDIDGWQANLFIHAYCVNSMGPKANFETDKFEVCSGDSVQFTDKSSGDIFSYVWDFGKDAISSTDTGIGSHKVKFLAGAQPGLRRATLTVKGANGTNSITKEYKLVNQITTLIAGPAFIKLGDTARILAVADADNYNWSSNANLSAYTGNEVLLTGKAGKYKCSVIASQGSCSTTTLFDILIKQPPSNDDMCSAIKLNIGTNGPYNNDQATVQPNEPYPTDTCCSCPMNWCNEGGLQNSVWFKMIAPSSGHVFIETVGFDDQIAVYNSDTCTNIKKADLIGANDDYQGYAEASLALKSLTPGKTYWIQVDGSAGGDTGTFYLTITDTLVIDKINNIFTEDASINVFPNPNNGIALLKYSSHFNENLSINLFDITGKKVYSNQIKKETGEMQMHLDLKTMPKGIYFLNVRGDKTIKTAKCIIQ